MMPSRSRKTDYRNTDDLNVARASVPQAPHWCASLMRMTQ